MEDTFKDCRRWEEEIFWTRFQSIQFFQFLRGDFVQRLEIPEKIAKNVKKKLLETVTLKGPSGIIWDVGLTLTADDDTLCFERGWGNFVKDHSMVENDLLIFKYNGVSHFDVLMFDGQSLCEKASSYLVRKCVQTEFDNRYQTKGNMIENSDEIVHNASQCGLENSPEKSTNNDIDTRPSRQSNNSASTNKKKQNVASSSSRSIHVRRSLGGKELSTFAGELKIETEFEHTTMDGDIISPRKASCKRSVTQAEKANVILMAHEALTKEGFMVVMRRLHSIPIAWMAKYAAKENADVILRINKRTWRTRFYYQRSRDCGKLSGGWRQFVNDNNLKEHDACVFEPANIGRKPMVLDVSIFHVLQAAVPLSQSLHEKACSYFVRKFVRTEFDSGYQTKRNMIEKPDEIMHNSSQCGLDSSPEKSTNNDINTRPSRQPNNSAATFSGEVKVETEFENTKMDGDIFSPRQASCKRSMTRAEKANFILMAQEALTREGFMVVMKPSHVLRKFFLTFPVAWVAKYAPKENTDVILRINKLTWRARFFYQRSRNCGGSSSGWRQFVEDNNLKEHDACVFEPANIGRKPMLLYVSIFPVPQAAVPLSQTLCEKAFSYFVRKRVHTEFDSGYQKKRNMKENPDKIVHSSSQCGLESSPEKSTNNDIYTRPSRQPNNSAATFSGEVKVETEIEHTTMDEDICSPRQASFKRSVIQAEKANVILIAQEALTEEGFMVVMKPTHVGRKFYMAIPTAWVAKYATKEKADVILRINRRTWRTRTYCQTSGDCLGLSGGWRKFVNDNNLKEHDVCVCLSLPM